MREAILNFNEQFIYEPVIENKDKLIACHKFIVLGMGGSHLEADLVLNWDPSQHILIRSSYALPEFHENEIDNYLVIASSYSGNTEEVVSGLQEAIKRNLNIAVIATGGTLINIAKENNLPYVQMPDTGIQPRSALGFSTRAILKVMNLESGLKEIENLVGKIHLEELELEGKRLAGLLKDHVPVVYASDRNKAITYNWKIKFNETGKIPAFYNVFPELNHNEMTGFDVKDSSKHLSERFKFIFIKDPADHPKILKRMEILEKQYTDRDLPVITLSIEGATIFEKIFRSLLIADWTAVCTADLYNLESEQVPMIEEFKKMILK